MSLFILPTSEIVQEFKPFDSVFHFYKNGIKGVILDTIVISNGHYLSNAANTNKLTSGLTAKVLEDYEQSPETIHLRFAENTNIGEHIEMISDSIDELVSEMMNTLFGAHPYTLHEDNCYWVGNDVCAKVDVFGIAERYEF